MADFQVGDRPTLTYDLRDPITGALTDATVVASAANLDTGTTAAVTVTRLAQGQYAGTFDPGTGPLAGGVWEVTFNATGTLVDETAAQIFIALDAALPPWAPTLRQVGTFVPSRTRAVGVDVFDNTFTGTFSDQTTPTGEQVSSLIGQACAWVAAMVGAPLVSAAYGALQLAATLRAAAWVELTYPDRDADVSLAESLAGQAGEALTAARTTNLVNGGGGTEDAGGAPVTLVTWTGMGPLPQTRYLDKTIT